jgi:hypothetical protein
MKDHIMKMAKDLCHLSCTCEECGNVAEIRKDKCQAKKYARRAYEKGYHKQSEGRWKGAGLGDYLCSECWSVYSGGDEYNFCPNCGAKMKEAEA